MRPDFAIGFLDRSGVPLLETRLDCSGKQPVLHLKQSRYLPLGSIGDASRTRGMPVCARSPEGTDCILWQWFVDNCDAVYKRTGAFASGYLRGLAGGGECSEDESERLTTFFKPRLKDLPGTDRGLAHTTEVKQASS